MRDEACELTEEDTNMLYERAKAIQADIEKALLSESSPVMVMESELWRSK